MGKTIHLSVNGRPVTAEIEPRLQLADFLRDHLLLTGTHLGCEHGVCGACTVQIDGAPARSCIAYAVACDGAEVQTIEGFDEDPVMAALREAFSAEHALQCGYCTPGMLITARDIVVRVPDADEARIRKELAGNLCRCTGYVGIVRAIQSVLAKRGALTEPALAFSGRSDDGSLSPEPGETARVRGTEASDDTTALEASPGEAQSGRRRSLQDDSFSPNTVERVTVRGPGLSQHATTLYQSFTVDHPRDKVWDFFGRLDEITLCLPGTSLRGEPTDDHVETTIRIKLGPIVAEFEGSADTVREASNYAGTICGAARDSRSSSATRGEIRYVLIEEKGGAATRVNVDVAFTLTGPLAQFGRSSIVHDISRRMTAAFAQNLEARLNREHGHADIARPAERTSEINAGSLFLSVLWGRIKTLLRSLLGR